MKQKIWLNFVYKMKQLELKGEVHCILGKFH